jgi:hypothetical protein
MSESLPQRGTLFTAKIIDREPETVEFKRTEDGKYTLTFDELPLLLFASTDGNGSFDQLFINGKWISDASAITIESKCGELTEYIVRKYACVTE